MNVGTGGEANWQYHTGSRAHKKASGHGEPAGNTAAASGKGLARLTSWFQKLSPRKASASPSVASSLLVRNTAKGLSLKGPAVGNDEEDAASKSASSSILRPRKRPRQTSPTPTVLSETGPERSASQIEAIRMIRSLALSAITLPLHVGEGKAGDVLASFAGKPSPDPLTNDHSEFFNRSLHAAFGWGQTIEELSNSLRRGPLGVKALCSWLEVAVLEYGLEPALLEPRIERMMEAIEFMYAHFHRKSMRELMVV